MHTVPRLQTLLFRSARLIVMSYCRLQTGNDNAPFYDSVFVFDLVCDQLTLRNSVCGSTDDLACRSHRSVIIRQFDRTTWSLSSSVNSPRLVVKLVRTLALLQRFCTLIFDVISYIAVCVHRGKVHVFGGSNGQKVSIIPT